MSQLLKDCLSSRYTLAALIGLGLLGAGLLAWGVAPKLILSTVPLLGVAACILPCLLALYWLRRSTAVPASSPRDDGPTQA